VLTIEERPRTKRPEYQRSEHIQPTYVRCKGEHPSRRII